MKLRLLLSSIFCMFILSMYGQSVGLIGSATPGGWDVDTNMVQNADSAHLWTLEITLIDGAAKFRQDDDWAVNWGSTDFPSGIGEQDGGDIPVFAGDYSISFNSNTGAYYFDVDSPIGIIGDATPAGWDADTDMYKDQTDSNKFFVTLDLIVGGAKFRQDDDWVVNWGSADFPVGVGTQDGDNIAVDKAGTYFITLDTASGAYEFAENVTYESIGIIGDATPGGWDAETGLSQDANDPNLWMTNIELIDGEVKFRANDDWDVNWGGGMFPMDTAVAGGDNIAVTAGLWQVSFNTETLIYNFIPVVYYSTVGIIGDATPGGWDADTDMVVSETDSAVWNLRIILADGEAKFRADDDWPVNWGGGDFPTGLATRDGANIPVTAGEYITTFNTTTGAYHFEQLFVYDTIGLIGTGTMIGDWDNDVYMNKDADDEQLWTLTTDLVDGEVKFRAPTHDANDPWAVNWGPEVLGGWPSGIGIPFGQNIQSVAGTYLITLRSDDGSYSFQEPSSLNEPILNDVKIYPNPTSNVINIEMPIERVRGNVNIDIIDVTGKIVMSVNDQAKSIMQINVTSLTTGNYFVRMYNKEFFLSKPISISK